MSTGNYSRNDREDAAHGNGGRSPLWLVLGGIVLVGAVLLVLWYFDVHKDLLRLLEWIDRQGNWAALLFVIVMAIVVVLLLPGVFFTTGAGFVFGIFEGTVYVVLGTTLGAAAAFLIARYLVGERARRWLLSNKAVRAFTSEAEQHDFKVVLLTRLIPFFPGKLSNYVFGLSGFSFSRYVLASLIGFIPFSLNNVYLGSMAADLASVGAGELSRTPLQWALYGLGFVATIIALVYFNRMAQRSLADYQR